MNNTKIKIMYCPNCMTQGSLKQLNNRFLCEVCHTTYLASTLVEDFENIKNEC